MDVVSALELSVDHFVGETSSADGNTSQHTVALILVHDQGGLHTSGLLVGVGHNTTDEVRLGLVEGGHEVIKLALEERGHSLAASLLLPVLVLGSLHGLTRVVGEAGNGQRVAAILDQLHNSVIERILVLVEPSSQVVGHGGGIMNNSKVRIGIGPGVSLGKVGPLAQQVGVELLAECLVSGLGEEGLLLKDGQESHGLLKHVDARLEIHTEVNIGPVKTLPNIFLLLEGEHVLVEELLELLIDVVNTDLLETVVIKNFKSGNVQHSDIVDLLHGGVAQSLVTLVDNNPEGSLVDGTSNTGNRVGSIGTGGALVDPLSSDLQLGLAEVGDHPLAVNAGQGSDLLGIALVLDLSLLLFTDGDKVLGHVAHVHHGGSVLVHVVLLILSEAKSLEGLVSELHVLLVVDGRDSELSLGDVPVVQDFIGQEALLLEVGDLVRHDVVEGMVASLKRLLVSQTRLLKQIDNHVSSGQLSRGVEMDTDELSESGGVVIPHSLGITPGLEHRVGCHNLVLKGGLSLLPLAGGADGGEVGDNLLGVLGLSGTRLSSDKDGLVAARVGHALVGALSNSEDVGPALRPPLADVQLHGAEGVDGEPLVGVDGDTEEAGVGVDQLVLVSDHRVPEDASVTEESQVSHVLAVIKLGGVDLADGLGLVHLALALNIDGKLLAGSEGVILDVVIRNTFKVAALLLVGVGHPHGLLGIIWLGLALLLHVVLHLQPRRRIRVGPSHLLNISGHVGSGGRESATAPSLF